MDGDDSLSVIAVFLSARKITPENKLPGVTVMHYY